MSKGRPPRTRSPQEKKALSYERDRRNVYGENAKASRKNIPLRKATAARIDRRWANRGAKRIKGLAEERAEVVESDLSHDILRTTGQKAGWRKRPDEPLRLIVARKLARRVFDRRAKARRRTLQLAGLVNSWPPEGD